LLRRTITQTEALQVLNLTEQDAANPDAVRRVRLVVLPGKPPPRLLAPPPAGASASTRPCLVAVAVFTGRRPFSCSHSLSFCCRHLSFSIFPLNPAQQFERYMAANDPEKGGSFYRAKEMLNEFEADKRREEQQEEEEEEEARPRREDQQQQQQHREDGGGGSSPRP
jgi:hypothetical protein